MTPRLGHRQSGIALVIVLWVVTLLTVIATSFSYNARGQAVASGHLVARAQARALADAGVQRAVYELVRPVVEGAERWQADGQPHAFELGGGRVTVSLIDEAAYIDLNAAQDALLKGLLSSAGVEEGEAQVLLDAILDWRDGDELVRPSGAEREQYLAAGRTRLPANAAFRSVDELKAVLGMTDALYEQIAGALTVHSRQPGINAAQASRQVLLALPGAGAEAVDAYLAARQEELAAGLQAATFAPATAFTAGRGGVYRLRSEAGLADGTVFVREAVVRLTGDAKRPAATLAWAEAGLGKSVVVPAHAGTQSNPSLDTRVREDDE